MKDTGGAAYPRSRSRKSNNGVPFSDDHDGMTLRDYFAGHAMTALISKLPIFDQVGEYGIKASDDAMTELKADASISAYKYADAMIKERNK